MSGTSPAIYRDGIRYGGGFGFNGVTEIKIGDEIYTPNDGLVEIPSSTITIDATPTENSTNAVQSGGVYDALQGKQDALTFDSTPTQGSNNPVTSDGIYNAIQAGGGGGSGTIDPTPTQNSTNAVQSGGVYSALQGKQDNLLFDQTPTANSTNPVTSGGVYDAIQGAGGGASLIPITSEELAAMWNN